MADHIMSGNQHSTSSSTTSAPLNWLSCTNFPNHNISGSSDPSSFRAPHYMPFPATQWNINTMPWKVTSQNGDGIVHYFTAHVPDSQNKNQLRSHHQKRKSDLNAIIPAKQFITEEKITSYFKGLHISNDYVNHQYQNNNFNNNNNNYQNNNNNNEMDSTEKSFTSYANFQSTTQMKDKLANANRITLCDELNRLNQQANNPMNSNHSAMLPNGSFKREMDKEPCTDLVLWQPSPIITILKEHNEWHSQRRDQENNTNFGEEFEMVNSNNHNIQISSMDEDTPIQSDFQNPALNPTIFQNGMNYIRMEEDC